MPINAQITENNASSVRGTTTTPSSVAGSTAVGVQPSITRMTIPGIKGADGDITWQGTWSSSTTYTQNNAIQYNGSSYVALQGNTDVRPDTNASVWSLMAQRVTQVQLEPLVQLEKLDPEVYREKEDYRDHKD